MDSLVASGIAFPNFYVSTAQCTPSRYGVLTGTYASRSLNPGADDNYIASIQWNTQIQEAVPHMASILKAAGYYTGFIGKNHTYNTKAKWPSSVTAGSDSKTQAVKDALKAFHDNSVQGLKDFHEYDFAGGYYHGNLANYPTDIQYHNLDWKVQNAFTFFEQAKSAGKPFFLHFATNITHSPYVNGTAHLGDPRVTAIGFLDQPVTGIMPARSTILERVEAAGKSPAQADVTWMDDAVKAMVDKLRQEGLAENTVIFYFNDNANEGGKASIYEPGCNTFGFISGAGINAQGVLYDKLVSNVDMLPTVMDLAGIPENDRPDILDGFSVMPAINDTSLTVRRSVYLEVGYARAVVMDGFKYGAIRTPDWWQESDCILALSSGCDYNLEQAAMKAHPNHYLDRDQLYDLTQDKAEQANLAGDSAYADILADLQMELRRYLVNLPSEFRELSDESLLPVINRTAPQLQIDGSEEWFLPDGRKAEKQVIKQQIERIPLYKK